MNSTILRALLLAGAAVPAALPAAPAFTAADATAHYDLPAQELGDRLRAIAGIADREIMFETEVVRGRNVPPLRGRFTFEAALEAALSGTGLVAQTRAGAVLVRPAAQAGPGPGQAATAEGAEIEVTGTRIRGSRSPSPVIVTSRQSLEQAGVADLAGFTRILPQNYTGGQNPGIAGGGSQGGQSNTNNSAALNLRGLGPDATLTLLNGHRLAYDALNQGIDIAAIPLVAIDRIEVVADGASALHGSDAVGGVANIILRRAFDGVEATARIGGSTGGGYGQRQLSLVGGRSWRSGGFMAAFDASHSDPIFADQRAYTSGLDPSLTLTLDSRQYSFVMAGRQRLTGGLDLELDLVATDRRSRKQSPFLPTVDVRTNGLITRPDLASYALAPTLRANLPAGWEGVLRATRASSRTDIDSRRFLNGTATVQRLIYENRLSGVEASAEGPLLALPGGAARLAVGAGLRTVTLEVNTSVANPDGPRTTTRDVTETRDVRFAYGELSLPLAGPDLDLPLLHRLSFSAALRYEHYEGLDEVTTPKLGLIWQPHRDLSLRAAWGRAFKVPTLNQVNQVPEGILLNAAIFAPQPEPPLPAGSTVLFLGGGNPGLRAERAETWSAGIELRPSFAEGLRLEAGYFRIDYRDRIASPLSAPLSALANPLFASLVRFDPTIAEVEAAIAALPLGLGNSTGRPFDPSEVGAILDGGLRNTASERVRGVDLAADYELRLGDGDRLLLTGAATWLESDQQLTPSQPVLERAGTIFNPPNWRSRAGASWLGRRLQLSAFVNHVGAFDDQRFPVVERIGPFVTLDLSASYRTGADSGPFSDMELRLSAQNLLGEEPDRIRNSQPEAPSYDSTNHSPIGRFISVSVRKAW